MANAVLETQFAYDCCDDTLASCVANQPECKSPKRVANWVCRQAERGRSEKEIVRALEKRAASMMKDGVTPVSIEHQDSMTTGCPDAPVTVTVYLCARCPYCAKVIPTLIASIQKGELFKVAKLDIRLFPIKTHKDGTPANLAFQAAAEQGKFFDFLQYAYLHFDDYSPSVLTEWAEKAGLDASQFDTDRESKSIRKSVVAAKKEGLKNGVEATPTVFINGRMYQGEIDLDTITDCLHEEAER